MTVFRALPALAVGLLLSGAAIPVAASAAGAKCTSGWTGSVQYFRSQSDSNSKSEKRVSGKGMDTTNWSMTYDYSAQIAVREATEPGLSLARANINVNSVSTETRASMDQHMCSGERTPRSMSGNFVIKSETRANDGGLEASVGVNMNPDGTYSIGIQLPKVTGTASGSTSASYSGQCTPKRGINQSLPATLTTIDGVTFSTSGKDRISSSHPDRLSGSHSASFQNVTETLSWNLRRCGGVLRLVDVKFEDMKFPTWGAWKEIEEKTGTTDGNIIRITAVVANDGAEEKSATVKFRDTDKGAKKAGARADDLLDEISVSIPSGEEREVAFEWDSSGYAWYDDGRPRLTQQIKAEVEDMGKKVDDMTRGLKVAPKPLVLVHGLWSNWKAWENWQGILTAAHSSDWKAFPVGQNPHQGVMSTGEEMGNFGPTNTIAQNANELKSYIDYAQKDRNAWHVDIAAHSMGGLISRRYIHASMQSYPDGKPQVQHLVMLGTPNMGSRCADLISPALEAAGGSMNALRELRPSVVAPFNAVHTERKGVKFSVLAGNPLPAMCYMLGANDGVVAVPSALWAIEDNAQQSILHTDMTGAVGFSSFVKPRVAIGPGKQASSGKLAALASPYGAGDRAPARILFLGIEKEPANSASATQDFPKIVRLAPSQTMNVSIPVEDARNFGLTFVAATNVSATLIDDKGAVIGTNRTGTPEASQVFRSFFVARQVTRGNWTLTLRNDDQAEREVILSAWSNAS